MTSPDDNKRSPLRDRFHHRPPIVSSYQDDFPHNALPTRSGALASLIRTRSASSLSSSNKHRPIGDEESGAGHHHWRRDEEDDIVRLLSNEQRLSQILNGPQARSMNLIGKSNPRYQWEQYWKREDELGQMKAPVRKYYERTNELIEQYMYIDALLDSSLPHELLNEYGQQLEASAYRPLDVPDTIPEDESSSKSGPNSPPKPTAAAAVAVTAVTAPGGLNYGTTNSNGNASPTRTPATKRTPKDIFRSSENLPLLADQDAPGVSPSPTSPTASDGSRPKPNLPWLEDAEVDSDDPIVTLAIWVNFIANAILLAGKLIVVFTTPSVSVLASLVDALLDFLSTAIVWITTRLISSSQHDQHRYPVGRRRLEPVGVLVFSIIMITSFFQVALESVQRLAGKQHEIIQLTVPAIGIMVGTIVIKGACWVWCRLVRNSSVRALAEDAKTDVVFNAGSILFPIVGFYGRIWWLDALGGLLLSLFVVVQWSGTSAHHVRNLTGFSAQPDERNLLLYLTMRFATAIRQIQNLRAYHAGDKLFVEVDIVLSANMPLKDSHDLSEVLTYFLESVPIVDRAFVHVDYTSYNIPTHIPRQAITVE